MVATINPNNPLPAKYEYSEGAAKKTAKAIQVELTRHGNATIEIDYPNQPVKLQVEHVQGKEYRAFAFGTHQNWMTPVYTGTLTQAIDEVLWWLR